MSLTDYTTPDDVRATLGVSDEDLDDSTIALGVYSDSLLEDLYDVSPSLPSIFKGLNEKAEEDRTEQEVRVLRLTRLFATHSVAKILGTSLPMFSPRTISDGKASMSRFSGDPYKDVLQGISEQYDLYRNRLSAALDDLTSSSQEAGEPRTVLRLALPIYDPVTGV